LGERQWPARLAYPAGIVFAPLLAEWAADCEMKPWKKFALMNVACLIGIGLSAFIVPSNTPFWLWLTIGAATIAIFNFFLYRRLGRSSTKPKKEPVPAVLGWIGVAIFLGELIFHFFHH
jgi:uncharacterized membrane protein YfcA